MQDNERRWIEIRFFYFCYDIYQINHDLLDITTLIEGIALITKGSKPERLKHLGARIISDINVTPTNFELVHLMKENNIPVQQIATTLGKNRNWVYNQLKKSTPPPAIAIFKKEDDEQIKLFMDSVDKIQKVGIQL